MSMLRDLISTASDNKANIARYFLLPQIAPRLRDLFSGGFSYMAFFMAQVLRAGNLIPATHPYLNPRHIGQYGIRDALAAGADTLSFDRRNIDKIVFFFAILTGLILLTIQGILLLVGLFIAPARAAVEFPTNYADFLVTENYKTDLAFRMMDRVFGIPGLFNSNDIANGPNGFHTALHSLFQFYSLGLLVIAVLILAYFVAAILAETAETGTPFGKRYNHVWAPVRLVVAFGLLIPISHGFNSAQWITLYTAKFGSGFATNGWLLFSDTLGKEYRMLLPGENSGGETGEGADETSHLIHIPNPPDVRPLAAFMYSVRACEHAVEQQGEFGVRAYLVKNSAEIEIADDKDGPLLHSKDYDEARKFFNHTGNIRIRFGERKTDIFSEELGHVFPFCGDLILPTDSTDKPGAKIMNEAYYELVRALWGKDAEGVKGNNRKNRDARHDDFGMNKYAQNEMFCVTEDKELQKKCQSTWPPENFAADIVKEMNKRINEALEKAVKAQIDEFKKDTYGEEDGTLAELRTFGWGGAGIYYNHIAMMNGALAASVHNLPYPLLMPSVMAQAANESRQEDQAPAAGSTPQASGRSANFAILGEEVTYGAIKRASDYWQKRLLSDRTENIVIDIINLVLGTNALFDMCKNADVHPLAQLAGVGQALIQSAVRNLGIALLAGGIGTLFGGVASSLASAASGFFLTFAMISLMIGFLMNYVIPFMPFLYFFFAFTGWVKGIFEAMVGVPLWALAHLRIDGEGLPGDAAAQGYFLLLEIFLRPILIIFGLIAAVSIYAAMVRVLNDTFHLVVSNIGGFDRNAIEICGKQTGGDAPPVGSSAWFRGPVDQFFFTVVYAIVVYLASTGCFKMIDAVPNKILRWMGTSVNSFGDVQKDAGEGLLMRLSAGSAILTSQLPEAAKSLGSALRDGNNRGLIPGAQRAFNQANPSDG